MRARKATKKTAFVPRVVFRAAFVGVVPVCAATACGSVSGGVAFLGFADGGDAAVRHDASAFDGPFVVAVATVGFGDASDGGSVVDGGGAGDVTAFDSGGSLEAGAADHRTLGVAVIGFGDSGDSADAHDEDALSMSVTMMAFGDR